MTTTTLQKSTSASSPALTPPLPLQAIQTTTARISPQQAHSEIAAKSGRMAVMLELLPGFFQVFGIGHIYAGRSAFGIAIMVSYWLSLALNIVLCFSLVGLITTPLTWLAFMVFSPLQAASLIQEDRRHLQIIQAARA